MCLKQGRLVVSIDRDPPPELPDPGGSTLVNIVGVLCQHQEDECTPSINSTVKKTILNPDIVIP